MRVRELIERAIHHLSNVGLKKGTFAHTSVRGEDLYKSPVCGVGAVRIRTDQKSSFSDPDESPGLP